jgi:hypothetical protein
MRLPGGDVPTSVKGEIVRVIPSDNGVEIGVAFRQPNPDNPVGLFRHIFGEVSDLVAYR